MTHEFELSDEQLAEVSGGSSNTRFNASQFAANFGIQTNTVDSSTNAILVGGGKKSTNELAVQGSTNNIGNSFTGVNVNTLN